MVRPTRPYLSSTHPVVKLKQTQFFHRKVYAPKLIWNTNVIDERSRSFLVIFFNRNTVGIVCVVPVSHLKPNWNDLFPQNSRSTSIANICFCFGPFIHPTDATVPYSNASWSAAAADPDSFPLKWRKLVGNFETISQDLQQSHMTIIVAISDTIRLRVPALLDMQMSSSNTDRYAQKGGNRPWIAGESWQYPAMSGL